PELLGEGPGVEIGDAGKTALRRAGVNLRVRAGNAAIEILDQRAVEAAPLRVGQVARCGAIEASELQDLAGRELANAAPLDATQQSVELLPHRRAPRHERG